MDKLTGVRLPDLQGVQEKVYCLLGRGHEGGQAVQVAVRNRSLGLCNKNYL